VVRHGERLQIHLGNGLVSPADHKCTARAIECETRLDVFGLPAGEDSRLDPTEQHGSQAPGGVDDGEAREADRPPRPAGENQQPVAGAPDRLNVARDPGRPKSFPTHGIDGNEPDVLCVADDPTRRQPREPFEVDFRRPDSTDDLHSPDVDDSESVSWNNADCEPATIRRERPA
jgi:hypothetical protein